MSSSRAAQRESAVTRAVHVFLVHSGITWAIARGAIREMGLEPSSVRVLFTRNYAISQRAGRDAAALFEHLPYTHSPESFPRKVTKADAQFRLGELDQRISRITGGREFHFYAPQFGQRWLQAVISSPLCSGVSHIEEGLGSYRPIEETRVRRNRLAVRLRDRWLYGGRVCEAGFFDARAREAWSLSPSCFPGFDRVRVVKPEFESPGEWSRKIEHVVVCDGLTRHGMISTDADLAALNWLRGELVARGARNVVYKPHPAHTRKDGLSEIDALFSADPLSAERLPPDFCLESLAAMRPDVTFWVGVSSTGFYAGLFGARANSYAAAYYELDPRMRAIREGLPRVFGEYVHDLEVGPPRPAVARECVEF